MLTLCVDTSFNYLSVCLIDEDKIIAESNELCPKKQSEYVFEAINNVFKEANKKPTDLKKVVVTKGPGSYTGIRIGMTICKTICSLNDIDLYVVSTLGLYANNLENTLVILDARSKRAYNAVYNRSESIIDDNVKLISDINTNNYNLIGDLHLIGLEDKYYKISECFLNTKVLWEKVDNVDYLTPSYLKSNEDYLL